MRLIVIWSKNAMSWKRRGKNDGTLNFATQTFKLAICDNTVTPIPTQATPLLSTYTQAATGGSYVAGGITIPLTLTQAAGVLTLDSTVDPLWALNAVNSVAVYWGIIYEVTSGKCLAFINLGGPISMRTAPLKITINSFGIFQERQI